MVKSLIQPSFRQGFARGSLSKRPNLWRGLVGCWKPSLGCTGINKLRDVSGYGNHGTMNGGMTMSDWVVSDNPRNPGYALDFDGSNDRIDMGNVIDVTTGDLSMTGWFNRSGTSKNRIVGKRNGVSSASKGYGIRIQSNAAGNTLDFEVSDGTDEYRLVSTTAFTDNNWHHFAVIWDESSSTNTTLYVDGVDDNPTKTGTIGAVGSLSDVDVAFAIGAESDGGNPFNGLIDDIRIYNRALSAREIRDIYENPNAMFQFRDRVVGRVAAGGALTKTINESLNINETLLNPLALKRILNEVEEISEAISRSRVMARILNEAVNIGETILRPRTMARILSETINISETILRPRTIARILSETINISEAILRPKAMKRVLNETINITESIANILGLTKIINETINIGEALLARLSLRRVLNETVNITETILRPRALARILNETVNIAESIVRPRALIRVFNETVEIGEAILRPRAMVRVLNETVEIADSLIRTTGLVRIINDTINISETLITNVTAAAAIVIGSARRVFNMDTARRTFKLDTTRRVFNLDTIRRIFRVK